MSVVFHLNTQNLHVLIHLHILIDGVGTHLYKLIFDAI